MLRPKTTAVVDKILLDALLQLEAYGDVLTDNPQDEHYVRLVLASLRRAKSDSKDYELVAIARGGMILDD